MEGWHVSLSASRRIHALLLASSIALGRNWDWLDCKNSHCIQSQAREAFQSIFLSFFLQCLWSPWQLHHRTGAGYMTLYWVSEELEELVIFWSFWHSCEGGGHKRKWQESGFDKRSKSSLWFLCCPSIWAELSQVPNINVKCQKLQITDGKKLDNGIEDGKITNIHKSLLFPKSYKEKHCQLHNGPRVLSL